MPHISQSIHEVAPQLESAATTAHDLRQYTAPPGRDRSELRCRSQLPPMDLRKVLQPA
jgi:hypothetical protein